MRFRVHSPLPDSEKRVVMHVCPISRGNQCAVWLGWLKNEAARPSVPKTKRAVMPLNKYVRPICRGNQCAVWLGWLKNGATRPSMPGEPPKEDDAPAVAQARSYPRKMAR